MFTPRERAALERMGETVMVEECGPGHVVRGAILPNGRRETLCGATGCLTHSPYPERVSLSDLRLGFVPDLCLACRKALGLEA